MKARKRGVRFVVAVLIVAGLGAAAFHRYWYYIPGIVAQIRDPVGPSREVVWAQGPERAEAPPGKRPPNIVLILADDLGYNDLTFGGGGVAGGAVPTPNIDAIAKQGVTFTNGYAGDATCAPSRAAIMTGRYATRFGFEFTPAPAAFEKLLGYSKLGTREPIYHADRERDVPPVEKMALPADETTIAELLKGRGYHTIFFGKWHLGETPPARPEARGFDETLGFLPGASLYLPKNDPRVVNSFQDFDPIDKFLWANLPFAVTNNGSRRFAPGGYMTDYLADEAVKAIAANRNRPFFLYLAFNAPHTPLQALRSDYDALTGIDDPRLRVYAAMIRALDRAVGKVVDALERNGLNDDTLVIFTSDNGGANYIGLPDINRPFRGWKATFFEGGIHVPFFLEWPAAVPAGIHFALAVGHVDIFATAAAAAGAPLPGDRVLDGVDLIPFVTGRASGKPHESLYWRSGPYRTLLAGDWKLQVSETPKKNWLFDLGEDPTEKHNLAESDAARTSEMLARLSRLDAQQSKPLWPSLLEAPVAIDHPLGAPDHPDDEYIYWSN
ncbi:MAG TPA: sulfatase-like hydrolase/transferase [Candidatus Bathyarchaeia archaeon]|nr:sulfatase-like hydrolase/transferase [Candidatus Bathyarchaeia archaeon]